MASIFRRMKAQKDKIDFDLFCKFSLTPALYNKMKFNQMNNSYEDGKEVLKGAPHLNLKEVGSKKKIKLTPSE